MDNIKAGHKTSEGIGTTVIAIVGLLMTYGIINSEQAAAWLAVVTAVIAIVPTIAYIISRTSIKNAAVGNYTMLGQMIGNLEETIEYNETD